MKPFHSIRCHVRLCITNKRILNLFFLLIVKKPAGTDQLTVLLCVIEGQAKSAKVCNVEKNVRQYFGGEFSQWRVTIILSLEQPTRNKPIFG
jgi:hypothetical protein